MAGAPRAFLLSFAMGLRSFSMSPALIPSIKELTSHLTLERSRQILRQALEFRTTRQVQRYMAKQILEICPSIKLLDSP
jgi:phosphotransferase system enzyme I (PtsI)